MKDIGYEDVESYVRTLVSEGLGQQIGDTERSVSHSDDSEEKPKETLRPPKRGQTVFLR